MHWSPRGRALLALVATLLLALALTACGSDDDDSTGSEPASTTQEEGGGGGGSAEDVAAKALAVAEEHKEVTEIGPTEPIGKPIPKDKHVIYVNCGQPACVAQGESFVEAAETLGWKTETIDMTLPTPEEAQAAFDEVIRRAPDGVSSAGLGPALYPNQVKKMNDMGIFVAEQEGEVETGEDGIDYDPLGPEKAAEAMGILANKSVADMGGEGEFGAVLLTGFPIVEAYTKGWTDEVEAICPECTTKTLEVTPEAIGKDAPEKIANFLRANPDIGALYISYDALTTGLAAALKNVGIDMPLTYAWGVDPPGIEELQTGAKNAAAPDPYNEVSWQVIDGMARSFVGEDPVQPFQEPIIWSKDFDNVPTETEPFPEIVPGYKEQFEKLWGLK